MNIPDYAHDLILEKFDSIYADSFDDINTMGQTQHCDDNNTNSEESFAMDSYSSSFNNQNSSSATMAHAPLKLNMNKNKMVGTCREYKHLDDEWKFDVDNFSLVEVQEGNAFHERSPSYYPQNRVKNEFGKTYALKQDSVPSTKSSGTNDPIRLNSVKDVKCYFVPSPLFLAQLKKRSGKK